MIDPRIRLVSTLLAIIAIFFYRSPGVLFLMLGLLHLFFLAAPRGKSALGSLWRKLLPLGLFILILWPLFTPSSAGDVLFSWRFIRIGRDNLLSSLLMVLRLFNLVFLCTLPMVSMGRSTFLLALVKMGLPYHWAFTLVLALQAVPDFTDRWNRVRQAQQARGLELEGGRFLNRAKNLIPLLTAVIVSALRDSDQLSYALINRGFDRSGRRTWLEELHFRFVDGVLLLLLTLLLLSPIMFS
ncbi:MAG: energy-coupling factor transporter transmembrane protein EcfT [Spirochaetales bacterium]|nr:energy-coupling factor transporter transmembrane protein EcfT [Spirochaetales bacterium]